MSRYIRKSHNVTVLLYHLVFPAKYRRVIFDANVDSELARSCIEIGTDKDHVHFLVQSVPSYSVTKIVTIIKSITARNIFKFCPEVKKKLWGSELWTDGYFASSVGKHGDESMISNYVKNQGEEYSVLHKGK